MLRSDQTPFMVPASYSRSPYRDLVGNPLAEALPNLPTTPKATFQALRRSIEFDEGERNDPDLARLFAINRVDTMFEPLAPHLAIFQDIYFHILNGYRHRPVHDAAFRRAIVASYSASMRGGLRDIIPPSAPMSDAMTFIGLSGVGKSLQVERILSLFPYAIEHVELGIRQVVSIKVDCPAGGSLKALILDAIAQVDALTGTDWVKACQRMRTNDLLLSANAIFQIHFVGALVIDEIQNLLHSREGADRVLEFLVNLANRVKVPLIFIGTPKALPLFQECFAQARRSGPLYEVKPLAQGKHWNAFAAHLWRHQLVKHPKPLTPEILQCWHDETFGIQGLAIQLFRLAQRVAIRSGTETVTEREFRSTSDRYMKAVRPAVAALRHGAPRLLSQYNDLIAKAIDECRTAA